MNKKIEKMFITGIDTLRRGNCQVYRSKEELEEAFDEQQIDIDEEILEIQVIKRYLVGQKSDLVEN